MKTEALDLASREPHEGRRLNLLREYLQAMTLHSLHQSEAFRCLSFVGGTALRFLFGLPRFSEDLDFSLEQKPDYRPGMWMKKLKRDLEYMGFSPEITWNDAKTVHTGWIKIGSLLREAGLAVHPAQKLSIKLEIDSRPPGGANTGTKVIQVHRMLAVRHHTLPCLMAGKIRAILTRPFSKGRDWYDLLWYCSRRPPVSPDIGFLQSSLNQGAKSAAPDASDWRRLLAEKMEALDVTALAKDVAPFLERAEDRDLLKKDYLTGTILKGG